MFKEERLKLYLNVAEERQKIFVKKEILKQEKPWTSDDVFKNFFFCNVFREQDKATVALLKYIIQPNEHNKELWKWIVLSRYLSRADVIEEMAYKAQSSLNKAFLWLKSEQDMGRVLFTSGFIQNTGTSDGFTDKLTYIYRLIQSMDKTEDIDAYLVRTRVMEKVCGMLRSFSGIAGFMSYEYACDFNYTTRYGGYTDTYLWTNPGPGATRGINVLLGNDDNLKKKHTDFVLKARSLREEWKEYFKPREFKSFDNAEADRYMRKLKNPTMREIEHWLCEFDKYCRVLRTGTFRRKYNGGR